MLKRPTDFVLALLGLVVLAPIMGVAAVAVKLSSPGPVIFRQKRIGMSKIPFGMYKFRTMRTDAPSEVPTHLMANTEQHLTPVGRLLRRYSLDELPQLVNVLKGDMSLVGPRPALWNQRDLIEAREAYGANAIRPGVTGWAQINGRDELAIVDKARLDGYYAQHQGLLMDLKCILGSFGVVVRAEGVVEGALQSSRSAKSDLETDDWTQIR